MSKAGKPADEEAMLQRLLATFRQELAELLGSLDEQIELLRGEQTEALGETISSAMRLTHNIKGAAGTVGITDLAILAHAMEDMLGRFRKGGERPDESSIQLLLEAITAMQHIAEEGPGPEGLKDLVVALSAPRGAISGQSQIFDEAASPAKEPPLEQRTESRPEVSSQGQTPADEIPGQKADREPKMGSVRVDVRHLDQLMNQSGELLVAKARFLVHSEMLEQLHGEFDEISKSLSEDAVQQMQGFRERLQLVEHNAEQRLLELGQLTDELGSITREMRMLPLNNYIPAWRRTVRESAQELGKQVELKVEVGDIELDKTIFDQLKNPFLHLLRNAVDHGIESPEEREARGKERTGRISIKASMRGAMVRIDISDDGRGLSAESIGATAVRRNIITAAQLGAMTPEEIRMLIFTPDFSTAAEVNQISGRGVGMSIVKQNLASIGGSVAFAPQGGQGGSAFRLTVPMSVLSIRGLLMRTNACTYAIPIENVERVESISERECRLRGGTLVHERTGEEPLRLGRLQSIMGEGKDVEDETWTIVVISHEGAQMGLIIDQLLGEDEFVAKRLPWNVRSVYGVNGAVVLGDGSLAIVLDVPYLFEATPSDGGVSGPEIEPSNGDKSKRILVVDDSLTARTMTRTILRAKGYEVLEAKNGEQAWGLMQQEIFDLVVSDIQMPVLDGLQLTRRIREDRKLKNTPIILVTNLSSPDDLARGVEAGADEYIVKERFNQRTFLEAVVRHV